MIKIKIDWVRFPTTEYKQTKMSTEQQNKMTADGTTPMWSKQIGSINHEGYIRYLEQNKMVSYQEQLAKCQDTTDDYSNIWKNKEWTIKDYEELFTDIERGYIIQGDFDTHHNYFIINPDFEEEEEEYSDDEDDYCDGCGKKEIWDCSDRHMCKTCHFKKEEDSDGEDEE